MDNGPEFDWAAYERWNNRRINEAAPQEDGPPRLTKEEITEFKADAKEKNGTN